MKSLGSGRMPGLPGGMRGCSGASRADASPRHRADLASRPCRRRRHRRVTLPRRVRDRARGHARSGRQPGLPLGYLQPSTGQQAQLADVLSRLPGFEDRAALDSKIDELAQRLLGQAGIDYRADVKPWLGNQIAVAVSGLDSAGQPTGVVVFADVKDEAAALARIGGLPGASGTTETSYQGITLRTSPTTSYAIVSGMMVLAQDEARVHQVIDTAQGRSPALAGVAAFSSAMASLPADRLATAWYDLRPTIQQAAASAAPDSAGFSTLALALRAEEAGFRVTAQLPVDPGSAGAAVRDALAAGAQVAQLANAMPADTEVAAMFFNLRAALQRAEAEIKARDHNVGNTMDQLRGLAAFGLGINIDNDLLPLLDGEVGVSVSGVTGQPHGVLLLRPTDAGAASTALDRIDQAVIARHRVDRTDVAAHLVTATVPRSAP